MESEFVEGVLVQMHGLFERMTPEKIRRLLNPSIATSLAVEIQALAASLGEPYSFALGSAAELEYALKNELDRIYLRERRREAAKMSVEDALVIARQETTDLREEFDKARSLSLRLKNILDRADKLASALQSHAATLRAQAQGGS